MLAIINVTYIMKNIKLVLAILGFASVAIISSCSKDKNNPGTGGGGKVITDDFTLVYTDEGAFPANAQQIFDLAPVGFKIPAYSGTFASNVDTELANEGTTREKVISINGESLKVSMVNNPTQNFDFMESIWVYVSKVDGSSQFLFGYKYNYALGLRELNLDMTKTDVKEVFNADSVKLTLQGTKRAGSHVIQANTKIEFKASVKETFDITP